MNSIIYVLFIVILAKTVHVSSINSIIIDVENSDIEKIADHVCEREETYLKQISKISTVKRVVDYLKSLPEDHRHSNCSQKSLAAIEELRDFLDLDTNNVCSSEKISRAEQIHRRYVVKSIVAKSHLPLIFKIFFYHYMFLVSSICSKGSYEDSLEQLKNPAFVKTDLDKLISALTVGSIYIDYKDIYLFWNLVDRLRVKEHEKVSNYINDEHYIRITVGVRKNNNLMSLQNICRTQFKPLYSRTILSTLRLIDMGYHPREKELLELLQTDYQTKRMYELIKVCETLLPIRMVELSPSMLNKSNVVLLSQHEVERMNVFDSEQPEEVSFNQCERCSVVGLDKLVTVLLPDSMYTALKLNKRVANRNSSTFKVLETLIKKMKPRRTCLLINKTGRDRTRKFLDLEMDKSVSGLDQSFSIITNTPTSYMIENQQGSSRDIVMYFLSFVWWFLSSY